jgi:hypothetical protein
LINDAFKLLAAFSTALFPIFIPVALIEAEVLASKVP